MIIEIMNNCDYKVVKQYPRRQQQQISILQEYLWFQSLKLSMVKAHDLPGRYFSFNKTPKAKQKLGEEQKSIIRQYIMMLVNKGVGLILCVPRQYS